MIYCFAEGVFDPPASPDVIENISSTLKIALPDNYLDFLRQHNGGEGFIGDNYVVF
jgi:hypothetical protein